MKTKYGEDWGGVPEASLSALSGKWVAADWEDKVFRSPAAKSIFRIILVVGEVDVLVLRLWLCIYIVI